MERIPGGAAISLYPQHLLDTHEEIIVDLFAGGGGASSGIEQALGRMVDIAINHDPAAVGLHAANHPQTIHHVSDVFEVDPVIATSGRPVALLWASPDCTFHSKARGTKPIRHATKKRRALAWVITRWAAQVAPRVIILENVEEFAHWGPLVGPSDQLRPCPKRRGRTFRRWKRSLENLGYTVEHRELRACDYGSPTIRKRLFVIARRDGQPIVWPEPTHGPGKLPYRTAAECIDWSIPMLSIFATKEEAKEWGKAHRVPSPIRPLAENTLRRIARGVDKFVLNNPRPFLVPLTHQGTRGAVDSLEPLRTVTTAHRGEIAVAAPIIVGCGGRAGQSPERSGDSPLGTVTGKADACLVAAQLTTYYGGTQGEARAHPLDEALRVQGTENRFGLVASFLAQNNGGFYDGPGHSIEEPISTILTNSRGHHGLCAAHIQRDFGTSTGHLADAPLGTITTNGMGKAGLVASFLSKFNGAGTGQPLDAPAGTATTKDRFGLATVEIDSETFVVADIAMRMLQPRELYRAQGFRDAYIIDRTVDGRPLTKTEQVRMCGNSVCPDVAEALVKANCAELTVRNQKQMKRGRRRSA